MFTCCTNATFSYGICPDIVWVQTYHIIPHFKLMYTIHSQVSCSCNTQSSRSYYRGIQTPSQAQQLLNDPFFARVTLTDYSELVPLMERNILHNQLQGACRCGSFLLLDGLQTVINWVNTCYHPGMTRQMDGWTDRQTDRQIDRRVCLRGTSHWI